MRRAEPSVVETIALGLVQGPAELFPISSSAHVGLLLSRDLPPAVRKEVEVALHAGTALALALTVRERPRLALLAAATVPPALAGLAFERPIEARLGTPRSIAAGLLAGALAMAVADRMPARRGAADAGLTDGAWLGAAQAAALIPGVSRSGATRAVARARGFDRAGAAALSREVALPVLAGAAALKGFRIVRRRGPVRPLAAGAAAAAASTWAALRLERTETPLGAWAAYRAVLAAAILTAEARSSSTRRGRSRAAASRGWTARPGRT
jgi:undecaprenyl-diphosphatase